MTGPKVPAWVDSFVVAQPPKAPAWVDSFVDGKTEQEQQQSGLLDTIGNLAKNWFKATNVRDQLELHDTAVKMGQAQPVDPDFKDSELNHIRDSIRLSQRNGSGLPQAVDDFKHFYGFVFNPIKDNLKKIAQGVSPMDVIKGIPAGLTQQIADFAEWDSDLKLTDEQVRALTPEEKAQRIKAVVGMGVMTATGVGMGKLLAARSGLALTKMSGEELMTASRLTAKGALAKGLMKSAAVGGASGAAYGLVAHSNEPDQLAEIITNGIVFAPLGVAHELLRAPKLVRAQKSLAKAAGELAQLKATQVGPSDSFESATVKVDAVAEANHIDEAALLSKIGKQSIAIVPGVDPAHIGSLVEKAKGYRATVHSGSDGTVDMLMHDGLLPKEQEAFFKRYGVYKGQRVSYNGQELNVAGVDGAKLVLRGSDFKMGVDPKDVRFLSNEYPLVRNPAPEPVPTAPEVDPADAKIAKLKARIAAGEKPVMTRADADALFSATGEPHTAPEPLTKAELEPHHVYEIAFGADDKAQSEKIDYAKKVARTWVIRGYDPAHLISSLENLRNVDLKPYVTNPHAESGDPNLIGIVRRMLVRYTDSGGEAKDYINAIREAITAPKGPLADLHAALGSLPNKPAPLQLEPEEHKLVNDSIEHIAQQKADLIDKALSNNMRVRFLNGKIELRDMESDRVLGSFTHHDTASLFIDGSGQSDAIDLDKDAKGIDTASAAGGRGLPPSTPIPPSARAYPWKPFEKKGGVGALELILRSMDNVAFITRNQDFFLKLDSDHQTQLHARVVDPTQRAVSVRNAAMKPWIEKLQPLLKPIQKLSQIDRTRISEYLKTMNANEVRAKFHVSSMEDAIAREAASADLPRVFNYIDQLERIDEEFKKNPQSPQDVLANGDKRSRYIAEAEKRLGLTPDDKSVADKLKSARELNNPAVRVGVIARLANSISSGELSRGDYATKFKLTGQQFASAHKLESLEHELNDRFGLPQGINASDYIDHANAYFDSNIERAMKDFPGSPDFFSKMGRAGFTPQVDPVHHILEYIRRGFDVRSGMQETMDGMKKAVTEEIKKLPDAKQKHVGHVINNYLDDLKGYPDANDTFLQSSVDTFLDKAGLQGVSADVRKNFVNTFLAFTHLGGVGFRGIYGLFHFHTGVSVSIAGRSLAYTGRMLAAGAHALRNPELIDEIRQEGGLSTISPIMQLSPTEYALESSTAQRAIVQGARKASELGLKLTLMPTVFEGLSAGHFLTTKADALAALAQYGRQDLSVPGGLSWEQVRKKLFLGRYDQAVEDQFKRFVDAGKPEDAASYLGRRAVNDLVGQFGNANRPYKWGTVWGRLLGQFGVWPAWLRSEVSRLASRGTPAERVAAVAKLSAVYWASAAAGNALGLDVHRLNPFHSFAIGTGPFWSILADIHSATTGTGYSQQAAKSRLQRMLPLHTDRNGNTNFAPSLLIPGSFELDSFLQGLKDVSDDPVLGGWEMAGGRPSPDVQTLRQRYGLQQ